MIKTTCKFYLLSLKEEIQKDLLFEFTFGVFLFNLLILGIKGGF